MAAAAWTRRAKVLLRRARRRYAGCMTSTDEAQRWTRLIAAEARALEMLAAIEAAGFISPGRCESAVDADIAELATRDFGVERHWHKRLIRTGLNTLCVFADNPPERIIGENDTIYLDLGPVFGEWEADIGQTYATGADPARKALVAALPQVFDEVTTHARATPDITGAELYAFACNAAEARGYIFGGHIAGHTLGEFPHLTWPGEKDHQRIAPANPTRLSDRDAFGRAKHWILEIHLLALDRSFGGFYERLLRV
jgi:Xaa-Pro dipeptidase